MTSHRTIYAATIVVLLSATVFAQPTTSLSLPDGPLKVKITGVQGQVQARTASDQKWEKATDGMELTEGAELRTGPRSAVRFMIGDDQVVTLDRLGTIQILKANFESGKVFTDLGMKYGRTRYDIESAAREHDAKVRSPSSVLAVRGTTFSSYDQAPFAAQAVSLNGRVLFRDSKKLATVGGKGEGKSKIDTKSDSAAAAANRVSVIDPKGAFSGKSESDVDQQLQQASYAANNFHELVGPIAARQAPVRIGTPTIQQQLLFNITWLGAPDIDVDMVIHAPGGEILSAAQPKTPSGGVYRGKDVFDGLGQVNADWTLSFPGGQYTVDATLVRGPGAKVQLQINESPVGAFPGEGVLIRPPEAALSAASPKFTYTDTFPKPLPTPQVDPAARKKGTASVKSSKKR